MVRDVKDKSQVYECYFPTEVTKGNQKLIGKYKSKVSFNLAKRFRENAKK